ncbi:threonine dehydratase, partial [Rhizobium ruizarguesonis]
DETLPCVMSKPHCIEKLIVEPAGAAGLAAILAQASDLKGCRVATMLCGANLTDQQIKAWLPYAMKNNTNAC